VKAVARPITFSLSAVALAIASLAFPSASSYAQQFNGVIEPRLRTGGPGLLVVLTRIDAAPEGLAVPPEDGWFP
jgi:hypothetical protein